MNPAKMEIAKFSNKEMIKGSLTDAVREADVSIGLSIRGVLTQDIVKSVATDSIVVRMANPIPEITPDDTKVAWARVVATGRLDFSNQINNYLGFTVIFKGALKVRARDINEEMKLAATYAIVSIIQDDELNEENITSNVFHPEVMKIESEALAQVAIKSGVARIQVS